MRKNGSIRDPFRSNPAKCVLPGPVISCGSRRSQGIKIACSRYWLSMHHCAASAQTRTSESTASPSFLRKGLRHVSNRLCAFPQLYKPRCPAASISGRPVEREKQARLRIDSVAFASPPGSGEYRVVLESACQEMGRISHSVEETCFDGWALNQLATTVAESQQVPGHISAINGGNIFWIERTEIRSVIPVVEMTAKPSICAIVRSMASSRSTASRAPIQPKSRAASVESR